MEFVVTAFVFFVLGAGTVYALDHKAQVSALHAKVDALASSVEYLVQNLKSKL